MNMTQMQCIANQTMQMMQSQMSSSSQTNVMSRIQTECDGQFGQQLLQCRPGPSDTQLCTCLCQARRVKQQDMEACMQQQGVTPPPNRQTQTQPTCEQECQRQGMPMPGGFFPGNFQQGNMPQPGAFPFNNNRNNGTTRRPN
jgi:hypothetical protein